MNRKIVNRPDGLPVRVLGMLSILPAILTLPAQAQQPAVSTGGIVNAADYRPVIAQGSMFLVFGKNLGPAKLTQSASAVLPTVLAETMVTVTVGTRAEAIPLVYVSSGQIAAILPSHVPLGPTSLIVIYQGRSSAATPFDVARTHLGLFTENSSGRGQAIAQNYESATNLPLNGRARPAHPGQTVILWGTGLGPVAGNDAAIQPPANVNSDIRVFVGGIAAKVLYNGRTGCCAGVDQVNIQIPAGVQGCALPLSIQIPGDSNIQSVSLAVSASSACNENGSGAEYSNGQFRFVYPTNWTVKYTGTDPVDSKYFVVHLQPNDASEQAIDVRYRARQTFEPLDTASRALTQTVAEYYAGGFFWSEQTIHEQFDAGTVQTLLESDNVNGGPLSALASGVWSRADFAHVSLIYNAKTVKSQSARDQIMQTLTFATRPQLLGLWTGENISYEFKSDGAVHLQSRLAGITADGSYDWTSDVVSLTYPFQGARISKTCQYRLTLGNLSFKCSDGYSEVLQAN